MGRGSRTKKMDKMEALASRLGGSPAQSKYRKYIDPIPQTI